MSGNNQHKVGREINRPLPKNARDFYAKPYLRAHELKIKGHNVQIKRVAWVEKFNSKSKEWSEIPALFFHSQGDNASKYLALSSETILGQVVEATGMSDPADWPGNTINIFPTTETVRKKEYDVIRVKALDPQLPTAWSPTPTTPKDEPNA